MPTAATLERQDPGGSPSPHLDLSLLGGFSIVADDEPCEVPEGSQRLLVYLALQGRPQSRTLVAASLWPEKTDARASANLRSSLWRLPTPGGVPLVHTVGTHLQLAQQLEVDLRRAEATGWALIRDPQSVGDDVDSTPFLLELLPGWYDDWVVFERERIAQLQFHFLEALTDALLARGRIAEALDVALRLVSADPLREGSHRALLAVYSAERNIGQARRHFETFRMLIRETFGCEPSPRLREMVTSEA